MVLQQQGKLSEGTQHFAVKSRVTARRVSVDLTQQLKLIYEPFFPFHRQVPGPYSAAGTDI